MFLGGQRDPRHGRTRDIETAYQRSASQGASGCPDRRVAVAGDRRSDARRGSEVGQLPGAWRSAGRLADPGEAVRDRRSQLRQAREERQQETAENMKAVAPVSLQQSLVQHLTTAGDLQWGRRVCGRRAAGERGGGGGRVSPP